MSGTRPVPRLTSLTRFFWQGGADGKLRLMRCQTCRMWVHPPQPICPRCMTESVTPEAVAGTGTIHSLTINYQSWRRDIEVPYIIARVTIDGADGVILTTNIIGSPVNEVAIGDPVQVVFKQQGDIWYPLFEIVAKCADIQPAHGKVKDVLTRRRETVS